VRATLDTKVRDVMHHGVITIHPRMTAGDICRIMSDNHVSCVAVASSGGEPIGVVTNTNIMACGPTCSQAGPMSRAEAIMSSPIIAVDADDTLRRAIEVLVEHRIHRVLVRSGGNVAGVLSATDVVREIGKTVRGQAESIYIKMDRLEAGLESSGEIEIGRETVYDVMTHGVLMVPSTLNLRKTAKVISDKQVHRLVVTDDHGQLVGVVSPMDILRPWAEDHGSVERDDVSAADVMTQDIEAIEYWRTLGDAMERMAAKHIHALLVLRAQGEIPGQVAAQPTMSTGLMHDGRVPIGLISASDVVREIGKTGRAG
jgi:predicted transcriptional regulator